MKHATNSHGLTIAQHCLFDDYVTITFNRIHADLPKGLYQSITNDGSQTITPEIFWTILMRHGAIFLEDVYYSAQWEAEGGRDCPYYGSVKVATDDVEFEFSIFEERILCFDDLYAFHVSRLQDFINYELNFS